MDKAYKNKFVFVNDQAPELDADNLNKISNAIDVIDDRVIDLDTNKANKKNPDTSGSFTHNGDMFVSGNFRHYEGESLLHDLSVNSIDHYGTPIEFKQEVNFKKDGVELDNAFGQIIENKKTIEELESKPTSAMLLESASPLEYATNNNIVGLYAEGKSWKWNQLARSTFTTGTNNGITYTLNNDGSWTISGKKDNVSAQSFRNIDYINETTKIYKPNRSYYMFGGTDNIGLRFTKNVGSIGTAFSSGAIFRYTEGSETGTWIRWDIRADVDLPATITLRPYVIDLTAIFGDGNEPTSVDDERIKAIKEYAMAHPQYDNGSIVDASGVVEAHNKNLFNKNDASLQLNNVYIATDGTASSGENNFAVILKCEPNTNYAFRSPHLVSNNSRVALFTDMPKVGSKGTVVLTLPTNSIYEGTVYSGNNNYILFAFNHSGIGYQTFINDLQIEFGTTASEYVPYKSNSIDIANSGINLRSIPNSYAKDTLIVNEDGSGEWVQNVKSVKLTTVLGIGNANTDTAYARFDISDSALVNYDTRYACTHFGVNNTTDKLTTEGSFFYSNNLRCRKSGLTTKAQWDEWIAQNEVIFYYPLATPIVHTLTKDQVDAIRQLKTYEGITLVDAELANVTIKYAGDTKKYVDEKDNELRDYADDKDTAILELAISEAMLYTQNMVKGLKEYALTEEYVGTFLGEDLYRRVFKGNVTSNATTSNGQEVTWLSQKVVKMIDGHVGLYPLQRYVEANDYLRVDWFSRMMDSDYHTIPIINIHCSSNYVGLGYEIVVYYTKPYEYGTMTPPTPIVTSLDDDAEVLPMSEGEDKPTALEPTPLIAEDEVIENE